MGSIEDIHQQMGQLQGEVRALLNQFERVITGIDKQTAGIAELTEAVRGLKSEDAKLAEGITHIFERLNRVETWSAEAKSKIDQLHTSRAHWANWVFSAFFAALAAWVFNKLHL